jgi:hypothetical protein
MMILSLPTLLIAEDKIPVKKELTKAELVEKTYSYAKKYNIDSSVMITVINCENRDWDTKLQSRIINNKGIREDSWGLSQIHLPSHPSISLSQATDPDFSLNFMAENLSKGNGNMWTCYRKMYAN